MREIKFRVWSGKQGAYVQHSFSVLADGSGIRVSIPVDDDDVETVNAEFYFKDNEDLVVQQYTGSKDKNGVEIYEGDLLKWVDWREELTDRPDIYRVDWLAREARFSLNCFRDGRQIDPKEDMMRLDDEFEVIGNIYENPELFEAKS